MHNASHPKRLKEARRAQRRLRGIAGRLVRDLWRKMDKEALAMYQESLELFQQVLAQDRTTKDKRYSLHEPDVWCIAKGKLRVIRPVPFNGQTDRTPVLVQSELRDTSLPLGHVASGYAPSRRLVSLAPFGVWPISGTYRMPRKKYEFGCKVSVARASDSGVIVGMKSFKGNPYDGDTLKDALDQVERIRVAAGGTRPERATADRGYKGRPQVGTTQILTPGKGTKTQTANEKKKQRERFRKRAGIEPVIGHLKSDHRMGRNFLARAWGDAVNCLLAGSAFNLKMRLNMIRASFYSFLRRIWSLWTQEIAFRWVRMDQFIEGANIHGAFATQQLAYAVR